MSKLDFLVYSFGFSNYQNYLKSEHWKNFSNSVRKTSCFCCAATSNLQVHHITYERLCKELPQDVITVCDSCHVKIHELVKSKTCLLESAHFEIKSEFRKHNHKPIDKSNWVSWLALLNKSTRQTVENLKDFLESKKLMKDKQPTELAFKLKFAREIDGKFKWNRKNYLKMMQADKSVRKALAKNKKPHRIHLQYALWNN